MGLFNRKSDKNNDSKNTFGPDNSKRSKSRMDSPIKEYLFSEGIDANRLENPEVLKEVLKEQEYNNMFGNSFGNDPLNNDSFSNDPFNNSSFGL